MSIADKRHLYPASSPRGADLLIVTTGYYPFNGNATDESINANDGTVTNATLTTDHLGNANNAYSFNGTSAYMTFANEANFDLQAFTIAYWIKPTSFGARMDCVSKGESSYITSITSTGFPNIWVYDGSYRQLISGTALVAGQWSFVCYTYDKALSVYKIYINGVETATANPSSYSALSNNALPLSFGVKRSNDLSNYFNGQLSELFVGPSAMSAEDVLNLYNTTIVHKLDKPLVTKTDSTGKTLVGYELFGRGLYSAANTDSVGATIDFTSEAVISATNSTIYWEMLVPSVTIPQTGFNVFGYADNGANARLDCFYTLFSVESFTNNYWQKNFSTGFDVRDGKVHKYLFDFGPSDVSLYVDGLLTATSTQNNDTAGVMKYNYINVRQGSNYPKQGTYTIARPLLINRRLNATERQRLFDEEYPFNKLIFTTTS